MSSRLSFVRTLIVYTRELGFKQAKREVSIQQSAVSVRLSEAEVSQLKPDFRLSLRVLSWGNLHQKQLVILCQNAHKFFKIADS
ncbi:hypothetical protein NIES4074_41360 [Cylindrospermum sp. NIES-4074]|nr:hypothetical protein NIES4074_41360 [Cylindrospermum sp. NIES-4074]